MSSNWPTVKTGEIFDLINGFAFKSKEFCEHGVSVLKIKNVKAGYLTLDNLAYVDPIYLSKKADKVAQKNDLLITMSGNRHDGSMETWVGKVAWFNENQPYLINQRVGILRSKKGVDINPRYMAYQLSSVEFQKHFIAVATSSGGQANLSPDQIKQTELSCPPRKIQDEIVNQIGNLEDKTKLNSDTNQTLEQIAQAIFKSWFVDFDPVKAKMKTLAAGGSIEDAELAAMSVISAKSIDELSSFKISNPEEFKELTNIAALFPKNLDSETDTPVGWSQGVIADIAKLNASSWTKKNLPKQVHYVDLANTKNGVVDTVVTYDFNEAPSRARRILNSGDTIVGTVRPGNRAFAFIGSTGQPLTGSTGFAVLSPKEEFWASFVYLATTNDDSIDEYARLADGGAYPAIKPTVIADTPCVTPTKDVAQVFWQLTGAILKKAHQNRLENKELASLRDTLVPRLLSGEIDLTSEVVV